MIYETLCTYIIVVLVLVITWCFFKIRKLKDEIMNWRTRAIFSPTEADNLSRLLLKATGIIIEQDKESQEIKK